ncbi:MAG: hypothetical protein VKJ06_06595 [Vampirovibrionales bacterium]|nr:hypothetical protein [Vampirovibrionales bacterium]
MKQLQRVICPPEQHKPGLTGLLGLNHLIGFAGLLALVLGLPAHAFAAEAPVPEPETYWASAYPYSGAAPVGVSTHQALSQNRFDTAMFYRITREPLILQALTLLPGTDGEKSLKWLIETPARVVFKRMAELSPSVKDFDALSYIGANGQHMVFINEIHRNAPPEALAALLAHEALHQDAQNSIQEEITAWTLEARVWQQLQARTPTPASQSALVYRMNQLANALEAGQIADLVQRNAGYSGLPAHSAGFTH